MNSINSIIQSPIFPYIFALLLLGPLVVVVRQYAFRMIVLKERELANMALSQGAAHRNQALERMVMYLERIKPAVLVTRFDNGLHPAEFVFLADKMIQDEYEYNTSQQLYLSKASWDSIVFARNSVREILASTLSSTSADTRLEDYKTLLLLNYMKGGDPVTDAIDALRTELLMLQKM